MLRQRASPDLLSSLLSMLLCYVLHSPVLDSLQNFIRLYEPMLQDINKLEVTCFKLHP